MTKKAAFCLILAGCALLTHGQKREGAVRSVILVTIDTLRADHLSGAGYPCPTSPNLDAFMSRGIRFRYAFSPASSTTPALSSIMVDRYPSFQSVGTASGVYLLNPEYTTLAEVCAAGGMRTAAVVSNPLLLKKSGLDQGFLSYDDDFHQRELNRNLFEQTADRTVAKARQKLKELAGGRFFLWIHLQDPHGPYLAHDGLAALDRCARRSAPGANAVTIPLGEDDSSLRQIPHYQRYLKERRVGDYIRRYDEEIAFTDRQLEKFFKDIDDLGLLKSTLVIVTADHGEALGEDEFYFGHGHSVGLDQVRVPLAFVGPGIPGNAVIADSSVTTLDIFATVLDLLGLAVPPSVDSLSLKPSLVHGQAPAGRALFVESPSQRGIVSALTYYRTDRGVLERGYMFDDEGGRSVVQCTPLGDQFIEIRTGAALPAGPALEQAKKLLSAFSEKADLAMVALGPRRKKVRYDNQSEIERLRSLGYVVN